MFLAGLYGSSTAIVGTDLQACFVQTGCVRVGPGIYVGGGGAITGGMTSGHTEKVRDWSVGGGLDVGWGPAAGGHVLMSDTQLTALTGHGGVGGGFSLGFNVCYSNVVCSRPVCE